MQSYAPQEEWEIDESTPQGIGSFVESTGLPTKDAINSYKEETICFTGQNS
jgi:hypothetical protein